MIFKTSFIFRIQTMIKGIYINMLSIFTVRLNLYYRKMQLIIKILIKQNMSLFGTQLNAQINRLLMEIRLKLSQNKFTPNFRTIYRSFVKFDANVSGLIEPEYFDKSLNQNGIFLKKYDIQVFEKAYANEKGFINWFTFLSHLREPMGPVRRELVEKIFDSIDVNHTKKIKPQQLFTHFNANEIDAYKKNFKNQQQIFSQFLSYLSIPDGHITKQQFIAFYDDCNINFHHNDVFQRFVSNQWHYTAQKLETAHESEVKALSKIFRTKLIQKSQGTKDDFLLRKLFEEFDRNQNYSIGSYELDLMLKQLDVKASPKLIDPLLSKIDLNKSGFIEYDEFKKYLFTDPYPI